MVRGVLIGVYLVAAACPNLQPGPSLSDEERFNVRWSGRTEDDILVHYGSPTEVIQLSTGNHVDSYRREIAVSSARAGAYGNVASSSSDSMTVFCDRRFEIDKSTKLVLRAVIIGSACDYNR